MSLSPALKNFLMPSHTRGYPYQEVYRITYSSGRNTGAERDQGRSKDKDRGMAQSRSSPNSAPLNTSSPRVNSLVDRKIYASDSPVSREKRTPKSSPGSSSSNWLRGSLGSLIPFWKTLDIPPLERNYAGIVLSSYPEYFESYMAKLKTLAELQSIYIELYQDRQATTQSIKQLLSIGKGSKSVLVHSLTKLKRLTIFISTIVNLARLICKKPVNLYPFGISSTSPKFNWLVHLRTEGLYSIENTALLFTILSFEPEYTYKDNLRLVKEYFHGSMNKDPDDQFIIEGNNQLSKNIEDINPDNQFLNHNSEEISEIALNFLLGLQAEALFEHDCLAADWDTFLHTRPGVFHGGISLPYTLLSPEQILDAVRSEEQTLIEFSSVLSDIRLSGCNMPLVPVIPSNPEIEIYKDQSTDVEDDNILLAEAAARQAKANAPRIISLCSTGLEPNARPAVPPCSIIESKDISIDKDRCKNESESEANDSMEHQKQSDQTSTDKSTLTALVTALEMTERGTTLTLDSTSTN